MDNIIEIKAMNREDAIQRALKILEATPEQVVRVEEKEKSRSFFGFFAKDGIYEIEVTREKISEEVQPEEKPVSVASVTREKVSGPELEKIVISKAQDLLDQMGLDLKAEVLRLDGKNCVVNLYGEDNGIIIGKKGKTLNSYEYLLNALVKEIRVEVDVEGFKEKRNITLRDLARKMAEKALKTNKLIKLNPMPPRERKIIHEVINKYSELDTYSEGRDPKRYIVIKRKK
ncbi:MAG: RNA-binding cell elongation regulator Jag/EloR [Cetobacterium sp.]|uniref:RNA-binding cell elongation regulator Jag/EloR n=1 Tax=unclassified Cetobacterium TaxID=2630983 RepID=UPI00163B7337|nr:RNA-binding cell elongation regulator Jag/EloR [Cetobacterium sp. 2A]MBC2856214.1 KH domain-containing protein [Cetobacterium sp. 2A]